MASSDPPCEKCVFDEPQNTAPQGNPRALGCFIGSTIAVSELGIVFAVTAGLPEAVRMPVDAAALTLAGLSIAVMTMK